MLTLRQVGLRAKPRPKATVDGRTVRLPAQVSVSFGETHSYAFPRAAIARGIVKLTAQGRFSGPVTDNVTVRVRYASVAGFVRQGVVERGIAIRTAATLIGSWSEVNRQVDAGRRARARAALHDFADTVRSAPTSKLDKRHARPLLAGAKLLYQRLGGRGRL